MNAIDQATSPADLFGLEPSPDITPAGDLIRTLLARGWKKGQTASAAGVHPSQITRILKGEQQASPETHRRLLALAESGARPDAAQGETTAEISTNEGKTAEQGKPVIPVTHDKGEPEPDVPDDAESSIGEPLVIALADSVTGPVTRTHRGTWSDLSALLGHVRAGEKDGPLWIAGDHAPGPRGNEHVKAVSVLALDIEAKTKTLDGIKTAVGPEPPLFADMLAEIQLVGWRCIAHTSYSHLDPAIHPVEVAHQRYRLVFALSRPLAPADLDSFGRHVAGLLGVVDCFDPALLKPSQPIFLPRCPADRLALFQHASIDGEPLDVDALLADARRIREALRQASQQRQGPKLTSVIDAFNAAHTDIGAILREHGYRAKGRGRWLHPESSTGLPGVRLIPESNPPRIYSSHGCCPLADGHAHDAFDCWRVLAHQGDMTTAVKEAARLLGMEFERNTDKTRQEAHRDDRRENQANPKPDAENAAKPHVSRLRRCDLSNLRDADLAAPKFVIEPLIPRGHLTLFGGHGGSGKSSAALAMGAHVACGHSWGGFTVTQGRVLVISYEDAEELVLWRLKKIALEYQLPLRAIMENMTVIDATEAEAMMVEFADHGVRRLILTEDGEALLNEISSGAFDLVIIDNASDCFGGNENDRQHVRHFVRRCANSVKGHKGAVLLLAHIDKSAARFGSGKNSYSGSTAWHNSARSRLALIDDELRQEKLNVGKAHPLPVPLEWKGPVPVPSTHSGAELARALVADVDDAAMLECFQSAAAAGESVPAASTGPATFVHVLVNYPECPPAMKADKSRIKESVARLLLRGAIQREEYKNTDRKTKTRLVIRANLTPDVAPICANVELAQIGADRRTLCAAPMRIGGVGDWRTPENREIGTGALAHSDSPAICADAIGDDTEEF